jgi:uncharacterized damage-inducible protein DinB
MSADVLTRFRRWFEYEQDAHTMVLQSLESVPADRRDGPEFRRAVTLMMHIAAGRRVWLCRLGAISEMPTAFFPDGADLPDTAAELRFVQDHWNTYLGSLSGEDLNRIIEYKSLDGGQFRSRLEDVLAQLFGHSWYHRGQIAVLVRGAGGLPAPTDFIFWSREPIPAPE